MFNSKFLGHSMLKILEIFLFSNVIFIFRPSGYLPTFRFVRIYIESFSKSIRYRL